MTMAGVVEGSVVEAHFTDAQCVSRWVDRTMSGLPQELRPTHFGDAERIRRGPNNEIADHERFDYFRSKNQGGSYFLYGEGLSIFLLPFDRVPSSIWVSMPKDDVRLLRHGKSLLESFAHCGAVWCFGSLREEHVARNQFYMKYVDGGDITCFIGRDFRRYVPGLYWINYFANDYIRQMEIDVPALAERLGGAITELPQGMILRLYDRPGEWQARRKEVEDAIHQSKNFFSMRNVPIPTNLSCKNPKDFMWSPSKDWP